ncbi:MAG TPA: hypothetical protein VG960_12265 [Caulobacteraceae bacterium]|nr:hypothetical protein [Caulobacteraceae bacterium]
MSVEPIKSEVRQLLAQADEKLRRAQHLHDQGSDAEKVTAAGQLVILKRQKQELEARIGELEHAKDGGGATTSQWFKEDWMLLMQRLDAFIDGR